MNVEWESPWTAPGEWLLGNLHTHTKLSDGSLPVDETAGVYRNGGYDFLAVTDHAVLFEHEQQRPDGLLLVGGCLETTLLTDAMEMLALGVDQAPEIVREVTTGQEAIDRIRAANGMAFLAHPYWSGLQTADILALDGLTGIELLNWGTEYYQKKGYAIQLYEQLLSAGKRLWNIAVDDCHHAQEYLDSCRGAVMVRARERSSAAIWGALRRGLFYSTTGPRIHNLSFDGEQLILECDPVVEIVFHANWYFAQRSETSGRRPFTSRRYPSDRYQPRLGRDVTYCFVEIRDEAGRAAWSNPLYFTE